MSKVTVQSIYKRFGGDYLNKESQNLLRTIEIPSLTRLGMEINGIFLHKEIVNCVVWGINESKFLNLLDEKQQEKTLIEILKRNPPLFLLSHNFQHQELLLKINNQQNKNNAAIIKMPFSTTEITSLIGTWLAKTLAKWSTIHGSVINIFGEGTLIMGEPSVGKTEITLSLLKMNHLFVGDDAIDVSRMGNTIIAKPHAISNNFMQIRGLGILNVKEMYGSMKIIDETKITVVIELQNAHNKMDLQNKFENLGEKIKYKKILNVDIPLYVLPVTQGRNMCEIIEAAIIDLKLKRQGYNAAKKFNDSAKKYLSNS